MLKCRYLSQFSMADLSKNAANVSKVADQCPFMSHVKRTVTTTANQSNPATAEAQKENTKSSFIQQTEVQNRVKRPAQPVACTNTINCPFFKQNDMDLKKLIKKRDLDDYSNTNEMISDQASIMRNNNKRLNATISENVKADSKNSQLFDYEKFFAQSIENKKKDGSYRYFKKVVRHAETFPNVQEHRQDHLKEITIWCSNDYLGLGRHPHVQNKVIEAVKKYGAGSGGTRNISGSTPFHVQLEEELAKLHQKEAALLFTSCYVANDTTLYTMARMMPKCHILSDAGNHASMIQGIRNSGIPKTIFRHNDCDHLEQLLSQLPRDIPKIVAFESVHSMDGSICDIKRMCDITHKYGGISYIDEVHAVGLYGSNGGGIGERDNVLDCMDIITGTLGKAFGNIGGYIAASNNFVDTIRSYGSGFIFTTSLPPSVLAGSLAALEVCRSDEGRELRARHQMYASIVKKRLIDAGLPVMNTPSHIVPVMVGDANVAAEICNHLLDEHSIYIQSINYPTVARGTERLRIVPNPHHSMEMIEKLVSAVIDIWQKMGLKMSDKELQQKMQKH